MRKPFSLFFLCLLILLFSSYKSNAQTNLQIPSTQNGIIIDGLIDSQWDGCEFKELKNFISGLAVGSADISAQFKTLWTEDNLYILVDVTDDVKINDSPEVWQDDAVEVYLDINNDKQTSFGANDYSYTFRWNDSNINTNYPTTGVEFKLSATTKGYILEIKFPWKTLVLSNPKSGVLLGLDVQIQDDDNGNGGDNKIAWIATADNTYYDPSKWGTASLVGEISQLFPVQKPNISVDRGFYSQPFDVTISSPINGTTIYYTLDGSDPKTSLTAMVQAAPVVVHIDPDNTTNRGKTPGVVLRASAFKMGYDFSQVVSRSYIFVDKVKNTTSHPGHDWPTSNVNGQDIDLLIDKNIVTDSRYTDLIDDALLDVPTFSIVTDNTNLFDPSKGIYVNASMDGEEWERPVSVEMINPDGSDGFQIDAGLRIRGGYSRNNWFRKHAFRLFFRNEYGEGKLKFPLFGDEGGSSFDKVDLRCAQNYSWSKGGPEAPYYTFTRDVFSRDMQREMGDKYTRSRYYHLYVNGLYWGLYQTQERSEARFASTYFGGVPEDYDVIKKGDGGIEATDGNTTAWNEVWNLCQKGFSSNTNYYNLQGLNANGKRDPSLKVLVDIDNLIRYMNLIFYTGNFDAPVSSFMGNKGSNNFYAVYNRNSDQGFQFFAHDNEHTLLVDNINGSGINENRVNIGSKSGGDKMEVYDFNQFHPQWLHFKLSENAEYRARFADIAYELFFNNGLFTADKSTELFVNRTLEIDTAVIAESARWGDVDGWRRYTKDDDWEWAVNQIVNDYFPYRGDIVIKQLQDEGLLPTVTAPTYKYNGTTVIDNTIKTVVGNTVTIQNTNGSGSIKYTIDGTDPRAVGGATSTTAVDGANQVNLNIIQTSIVKARVFAGGKWSALHTLKVVVDEEIDGIQLTEIHYNPLNSVEGVSGNEFEFIELKNTSNKQVNLTTSSFVDGLTFTFTTETKLEPGQFIVLASNAYMFNERYGMQPSGEFEGKLDNAGERLTLITPSGDTIFSVKYSEKSPWASTANGIGFSLVPLASDFNSDWNNGENWRASSSVGGSPFADDVAISIPKVYVNEVLTNSETPAVDAIEIFNPNSTAVDIGYWYLSDSRSAPQKWQIPAGTTIPANGYKVFYEGHYNGSTLAYNNNEFGSAFSLSSHGDEIYIYSANNTGTLTGYEHGYDFGEIETGVSFGRYLISTGDDHFVAMVNPTLNAANSQPRVGPIVINQVMYNPISGEFEFIELVNISSSPVPVYEATSGKTWKVNGVDFSFPSNLNIAAGESVYLVESTIHPEDFRFRKGLDLDVKIYNFGGKLSNEGEEITLFKAAPSYIEENVEKEALIRVDKVKYNNKAPWPDVDNNGLVLARKALNIYGNDPANWMASSPRISITSLALNNGIKGVEYSQQLNATGGIKPFVWSISAGSLPAGLNLNATTGIISGVPTIVGAYNFKLKVTDAEDIYAEADLQLVIKDNTLPVAVNDTITTSKNFNVIADVLKNDIDNDGDRFFWTLSISDLPKSGTVEVNNDKTLTYIPTRGFIGTDEFKYRITDVYGFSEAKCIITVKEEFILEELDVQVVQSSDDAEETVSTKAFRLSSSDLELSFDQNFDGDQLVGIRFQKIDIPKNATITNAYVQFSAKDAGTAATSLFIHGEASDNALTFSDINVVSSRVKTDAFTAWVPDSWNGGGEVTEAQKTPSLAQVVQSIVNRSGWNSGNAMAFIISGTGLRNAFAYDGSTINAPKLHIEYQSVGAVAQVPVAAILVPEQFKLDEQVTLDGSTSYSSDGRMLNYRWEMVAKPVGSAAKLSNFSIAKPSFTPDVFGTYSISLVVDNGVYESVLVSTNIVVENHVPVANAGNDQQKLVGAEIRLNGSASSDSDGESITFLWTMVTKPANSVAVLTNATSVNPSFTSDLVGEYRVQLVVSDGVFSSIADEVIISIIQNQPPIASAGIDAAYNIGVGVSLDGSGSSDPENGTLTYYWTLVSKPTGGAVVLSDRTNEKPTFVATIGGSYVFQLVVSDGMFTSSPDEVVITIKVNNAPIAKAGNDQTVSVGATVQLNGSGSSDPEGTTLSYLWSFVTKPSGSSASLSKYSIVNPTFKPDKAGIYSLRLDVSDGVNTSSDNIQIKVGTSSVESVDLNGSLSVYPNPFTNKLYVDYSETSSQQVAFELYNLSGALVQSLEFNSIGKESYELNFDHSKLTNGIYLLKVKSDNVLPKVVRVTYNEKKE